MKVATWNVNSIRARFERLRAWLSEHSPDVVALQETKVEDAAFPHAELEALGYHAAVHGQRTYNGVALLARGPVAALARGFDDGVADAEARFIVAEIAGVRVASAYVPNGQAVGSEKFAYKLAWLERLRRWLGTHEAGATPFFLCGDFNVAPEDRDVHDPAAWKDQVLCHPEERVRLGAVLGTGLEDLFRRHHPEPGAYSWWDYRMLAFPKNRGLRIDHIFGNAAAAARTRDVIIDRDSRKGTQPSDHAPVIATIA